jgi:hypothetical protein
MSQMQWPWPVILATQKAKIGRITVEVEASLDKKFMRPHLNK